MAELCAERDKIIGQPHRWHGGAVARKENKVAIKWSARTVERKLTELERLLAQAAPHLAEAEKKAMEICYIPAVPQYISESAAGLSHEVRYAMNKLLSNIETVRGRIPEGAIEAEADRGEPVGPMFSEPTE